jgi:hypothetical protein
MFSRWIVTNITSASVTTFLAFLAGIISWSVYCRNSMFLSLCLAKRFPNRAVRPPRGLVGPLGGGRVLFYMRDIIIQNERWAQGSCIYSYHWTSMGQRNRV